jgi:hypothetical protein
MLKFLATAILLACVCGPASAQQQQQPTPRSRDTRGNDERAAQFACLSKATGAYAHYVGPETAREAGQAAYLRSCILAAMPETWSAAHSYRTQAEKFAATARQSDPQIDECLLTACATAPK